MLQQIYNPEFYLDRKFNYREKIVIRNYEIRKLIQKNTNSVFFFTGVDSSENLFKILQLGQKKVKQCIKNNNIIIGQEENGQEKFDGLKNNKNKTIHWLKVENINGDNQQLIWHRSYGSLDGLRQYADQSQTIALEEDAFLDKIKENTAVLIVDEPGMGKSTTLVSLSQKIHASYWVIHINLRDCQKAIKNLHKSVDINVDIVLNFLSETENANRQIPLEYSLARYKLEHKGEPKPLLLLFDGFDEIATKRGKTKISSLLTFLNKNTQATVWVTGRQHDTEILQNSLLVFDIGFKAFEESDQTKYLKQFWEKHLKLSFSQDELQQIFEDSTNAKFQIYSRALINKMGRIFQGTNTFFGVPLTLRLSAEIFKDKFKDFINSPNQEISDFEDLDKSTLFKKYIDARYEIFSREKTLLSIHSDEVNDLVLKTTIKDHQKLAVKELIGNKAKRILGTEIQLGAELLRMGLVYSTQSTLPDHFQFIHYTFAEYFTADLVYSWVIHNELFLLTNQQKSFSIKILIEPDYTVIQKFFDQKFKSSPISYDVWKKTFLSLVKKVYKYDDGLLAKTIPLLYSIDYCNCILEEFYIEGMLDKIKDKELMEIILDKIQDRYKSPLRTTWWENLLKDVDVCNEDSNRDVIENYLDLLTRDDLRGPLKERLPDIPFKKNSDGESVTPPSSPVIYMDHVIAKGLYKEYFDSDSQELESYSEDQEQESDSDSQE